MQCAAETRQTADGGKESVVSVISPVLLSISQYFTLPPMFLALNTICNPFQIYFSYEPVKVIIKVDKYELNFAKMIKIL